MDHSEEIGMSDEYQMCNRCVMNATDSDITFDENGMEGIVESLGE